MGKRAKAEAPAVEPAAAKNEASADPAEPFCGICGKDIDCADEYLAVHCNVCGTGHLHWDCAVTYLLARASEKCNSHAATKYATKARKRPCEILELRQACPCGNYRLTQDSSTRKPGSNNYKGKSTVIGACAGFTQGAEVIKPAKEPPAPLPQVQPARAAAPKKQAAAAAKKAHLPAPFPSSSPSSSSHASTTLTPAGANASATQQLASKLRAPGQGAAARLMGASRTTSTSTSPWTTVGAAPAAKTKAPPPGGGDPAHPGSSLSFPPGTRRPPDLTMCTHVLEYGDCHVYNCEYCHTKEELAQREKRWVARQEGRKREARQREAQAVAWQAAKLEEEQEVLAQLESLEDQHRLHTQLPDSHRAPSATALTQHQQQGSSTAQGPSLAPHLSEGTLALLRSFKRSLCLNSLLEMGFPAAAAQAAADRAGAELEAAVGLVMDGGGGGGAATAAPEQIDVSREVGELASVAASLGMGAEAIEAQLVAMGGNWEAAREALQGGGSALPEEYQSLAPSEPDTPSIAGLAPPHWAADASSTLSGGGPLSPLPQSPRAAAAAPAHAGAEPGVLSLADFSSGQEEGLSHLMVDQLLGEAAPAPPPAPLSAQFGSPLPVPLRLSPPPSAAASSVGGGGAGYSDGYAAGLAAAAAMLQQQQQYGQQYSDAAPAHDPAMHAVASGAMQLPLAPLDPSLGFSAPPASHPFWQQPGAGVAAQEESQEEDELQDLLKMLGVS